MKKILILICILYFTISCKKNNIENEKQKKNKIYKPSYTVAIVTDTIDDWSIEVKDGIIENLNNILSANNSKAKYKVYDTKINIEQTTKILTQLKETKPDIIFTLNYPDSFADIHVSKHLANTDFKIVSMNPVPVEAGIIDSLDKPGGNITGVSIFLQMSSPIKLMKKIKPGIKKLAIYSWDKMELVNQVLERELTKACKEEKIELVEFRRVSFQEDAFDFFYKYGTLNQITSDYFLYTGISVFLKRDGSPADDTNEAKWLRESSIPAITYDELGVESGCIAGVTTIWSDIGSQLAEKAQKIIEGEKPGNLPWECPREYNILINQKRANLLNIKISENILNAAYRIYTDYEGNYIENNP